MEERAGRRGSGGRTTVGAAGRSRRNSTRARRRSAREQTRRKRQGRKYTGGAARGSLPPDQIAALPDHARRETARRAASGSAAGAPRGVHLRPLRRRRRRSTCTVVTRSRRYRVWPPPAAAAEGVRRLLTEFAERHACSRCRGRWNFEAPRPNDAVPPPSKSTRRPRAPPRSPAASGPSATRLQPSRRRPSRRLRRGASTCRGRPSRRPVVEHPRKPRPRVTANEVDDGSLESDSHTPHALPTSPLAVLPNISATPSLSPYASGPTPPAISLTVSCATRGALAASVARPAGGDFYEEDALRRPPRSSPPTRRACERRRRRRVRHREAASEPEKAAAAAAAASTAALRGKINPAAAPVTAPERLRHRLGRRRRLSPWRSTSRPGPQSRAATIASIAGAASAGAAPPPAPPRPSSPPSQSGGAKVGTAAPPPHAAGATFVKAGGLGDATADGIGDVAASASSSSFDGSNSICSSTMYRPRFSDTTVPSPERTTSRCRPTSTTRRPPEGPARSQRVGQLLAHRRRGESLRCWPRGGQGRRRASPRQRFSAASVARENRPVPRTAFAASAWRSRAASSLECFRRRSPECLRRRRGRSGSPPSAFGGFFNDGIPRAGSHRVYFRGRYTFSWLARREGARGALTACCPRGANPPSPSCT